MKLVVALLFASSAITGPSQAHSPMRSERVLSEVVLVRHGVRSPTKPGATYADYTNAAWPEWPVAPGMLTAHGREGMQAIGNRLRRLLSEDGLIGQACPTSVTVIGDSTTRNRESSRALSDGLAPGCGLGFLAATDNANNPLFHYPKDDDDAASSGEAHASLADLQSLLLNCRDDCAAVAKRDDRKLLPADAAKAMKLAGTLSENLMLAYVEGMPMSDVAFGRGGADVLGTVISLHNVQFAATKKAMPAASRAGSNLVAHIAATLETASGAKPAVTPFPATTVLVGHDTNLAHVAGVLGLDWHDASRPDDYPPGGALAFALVRRDGDYVVRVRALMASMDQLRANRFDDMKAVPVHVAGCRVVGECTLAEFRAVARHGIDPSRVDAGLPAMTLRHAP